MSDEQKDRDDSEREESQEDAAKIPIPEIKFEIVARVIRKDGTVKLDGE